MLVIEVPAWTLDPDRHCAGMDPDLFFRSADMQARMAADICDGCPVILECQQMGAEERWGLFGGIPQGEPGRPSIGKKYQLSDELRSELVDA